MSRNGKSVMDQKKEELKSAKGKNNDWKKWGYEFPLDILGWFIYLFVGFNSLSKMEAFSGIQVGGNKLDDSFKEKGPISSLFPNVKSWEEFAGLKVIKPTFETRSEGPLLFKALFDLNILKNTMYFNFYRIHQIFQWSASSLVKDTSPGMNMLIVFLFPIILLSLVFVAIPINIFNFVYVLWETGNQYGWFPILVNILLFAFFGVTFLALLLSLFIAYTGLWTPGKSPKDIFQKYLGNSEYNYFWSIILVIIAGPMYSASKTSLSSNYQQVFGWILAGLIAVVFGVALFAPKNKS